MAVREFVGVLKSEVSDILNELLAVTLFTSLVSGVAIIPLGVLGAGTGFEISETFWNKKALIMDVLT
jgi:hypothetical protein